MNIIETYTRTITTEKHGTIGTIEVTVTDIDARCEAKDAGGNTLGVYHSDEQAWTAITRNRQGRPIPESDYWMQTGI